MTDTPAVNVEIEEPSSIRDGFIRWIIVATIMVTLLFVYLLITMMSNEKEKQTIQAEQETVPQQVNDANHESVAVFNKSIGRAHRAPAPEPMQDLPINQEFAPKKLAQNYEQPMPRSEPQEKQGPTAYEQFLEEEKRRALQSLKSKDDLGETSGFYEKDDETTKSVAQVKPREKISVDQRREAAAQQQQVISDYIESLKSGTMNASAQPPAALLQGMGTLP